MESPSQSISELPATKLPPRKKVDLFQPQIRSNITSNLRKYGSGLLKLPLPYSQSHLQQSQSPELSSLPPRHVADRLLGQYFDCIHRQFPALHWPTFHDEYQRAYHRGTSAGMRKEWGAVLFCVLACGTLHTLDRDRVRRGREYLVKSMELYDIWQDEFSLDSVRVALLISIFLTEINLKTASWIWLSSAIRISQHLGLHKEGGLWRNIEREMGRRIWYCVYAWDRFVALLSCTSSLTLR